MHWRGTPGAKRGTPVLNSKREIQACMTQKGCGMPGWAWHANSLPQEESPLRPLREGALLYLMD
ncbi:hypothetical protein AHAS_Ahas09G0128700 [Arachis hypogaea]